MTPVSPPFVSGVTRLRGGWKGRGKRRGGVTTFHASSQGFLLMPEHLTVKWKHCDNLTISGFGLSYEGSSYQNPTAWKPGSSKSQCITDYWWSDCDLILGNSHENNQTMARTGSDWTTVLTSDWSVTVTSANTFFQNSNRSISVQNRMTEPVTSWCLPTPQKKPTNKWNCGIWGPHNANHIQHLSTFYF